MAYLRCFWVSLFCLSFLAQAENKPIYKTVDSQGRIIFTDNPPVNEPAESVDLNDTNVTPGGQTYNATKTNPKNGASDTLSISMVAPTDGAQIGPTENSLRLIARVNRELKAREGIIFYFDGVALNLPSKSTSYTLPLTLKLRGKRSVKAAIFNSKTQEILAESAATTFYIIRPGGR